MPDVFKAKGMFGKEDVVFLPGENGDVLIGTEGGAVIVVKEESLIEYVELLKDKTLS